MNRQPKGTPKGGEFAEGKNPDGPDLEDEKPFASYRDQRNCFEASVLEITDPHGTLDEIDYDRTVHATRDFFDNYEIPLYQKSTRKDMQAMAQEFVDSRRPHADPVLRFPDTGSLANAILEVKKSVNSSTLGINRLAMHKLDDAVSELSEFLEGDDPSPINPVIKYTSDEELVKAIEKVQYWWKETKSSVRGETAAFDHAVSELGDYLVAPTPPMSKRESVARSALAVDEAYDVLTKYVNDVDADVNDTILSLLDAMTEAHEDILNSAEPKLSREWRKVNGEIRAYENGAVLNTSAEEYETLRDRREDLFRQMFEDGLND